MLCPPIPIDEAMPDLINDFKEKSIAAGRSWLIVFTSDHGEMLGDHFLFRKCEPYDGSTRIPLLIQGSADLELTAANRCETPVCLEDILPTLLDFAGISLPDHIDGKSLVGILKGEETKVRDILHCEHAVTYSEAQAFHMLTDGIMKYIWRPVLGSEQLFNLKEDPNELLDLKLNSKWDNELTKWRNLMIKKLEDRPEGFSDGKKLISHCEYKAVMPK